jgi:beta-glucanase (GH16 family)
MCKLRMNILNCRPLCAPIPAGAPRAGFARGGFCTGHRSAVVVFRSMRKLAAAAVFFFLFACATRAQEWGNPVWSDEFNSPSKGAPPDPANWTYDVGGTGWGNHELEIYCPSNTTSAPSPKECDIQHSNAFQDGNGHLVIRASRVSADPVPVGTWTSARLKSRGLKEFQYGRLEACIKLPVGAGLWPAFWMLGTAGHWPAGGEIDIMENIPAAGGSADGLGPAKIESTIHGPSTGKTGLFSLAQIFSFPTGQRIDDNACHVYGAIWSPFMIQMYVDDWRKPFFIRTAADVPQDGRWIFNASFYFLLNLAVGGDWPGPPDSTTPGTADMVLDYVRVYKAGSTEGPKITAGPLKEGAHGERRATVQLLFPGGGPAFLTCSVESAPSLACTVDTGNTLNKSVVDFSTENTRTANITLSGPPGHESAAKIARVRVTAYAVNGAQSSVLISAE